jgi:hypothetical protein
MSFFTKVVPTLGPKAGILRHMLYMMANSALRRSVTSMQPG